VKECGIYSGNQQEAPPALKLCVKVSSGFLIHSPEIFYGQPFTIFHLFLASLDQTVLWNVISNAGDSY